MPDFKIVACGLPASGKTTFLAALWYLVFNKRTATSLQYGKLPKARTYLNSLANLWSSAAKIERTKTSEVHDIQLHLKHDEEDVDLLFPDLSGEVWENIWANGACWGPAAEAAAEAEGILFFVHADKIRQPVDLVTANVMRKGLVKAKRANIKLEAWQAKNAPTQVVAIDLLQHLAQAPLGTRGRKLAILISAWDRARRKMTPSEFLAHQMPLLHQYVSNNSDYDQISVFGVSAQGGDLEKDAERLRSIVDPCERIRCISDASESQDITLPIKWLMER